MGRQSVTKERRARTGSPEQARRPRGEEPQLNVLERFLADTFDFLSSLKLAIVLLSLLVVVLSVGTIWEARFGTRAAQSDLYKAWVFFTWAPLGPISLPVVLPGLMALLPLLAVNIFCATLSRFPWQRRHTGFVITHAGLLVLLGGSFLTLTAGIDGQLALREGESGSEVILLDREVLRLQWVSVMGTEAHGGVTREIEIPLHLGGLAWEEGTRVELDTGRQDVRVALTGFYPRSETEVVFVDSPEGGPLVRLLMHGHIHPPGTPPHREEEESGGMNVHQQAQLYMPSGYLTESNRDLAPAYTVVRRFRFRTELRDFLNPPQASGKGLLRVHYEGGVLSLPIDEYLEKEVAIPGTGLKLEITDYTEHVGGREGDEGMARPVVRVRLYQGDNKDAALNQVVFAGWTQYPTDLRLWQEALQWLVQQQTAGRAVEFGEAFGRYRLWPPVEPVKLCFYHPSVDPFAIPAGSMARLDIALGPEKSVHYRIRTNSGRNVAGQWDEGADIEAWMGLKLKLEGVQWSVVPERRVHPVPKWENENAPPALRVAVTVGEGAQEKTEEFWLQRFETRVVRPGLADPHHVLRVSYDTRSLQLPFTVKLIDFAIGYDPGTGRPASYTSVVQLIDKEKGVDEQRIITMNAPMKHRGLKFYQSSYFQNPDGTMSSVFAVGRDPGYPLKAIGSTMIVLGIIVMFYMRTYFFAPRSEWKKHFGRQRTAREVLEARKR